MKLNLENNIMEYYQFLERENLTQATERGYEIEKQISINYIFDNNMIFQFFISFGLLLFEQKKYSEFFQLLQKAQKIRELPEKLVESIEEIFIYPNISTYQENYNHNRNELTESCVHLVPCFEQIDILLLPTEYNDVFFTYDRKKKKIGEFLEYKDSVEMSSYPNNLFSDFVIQREKNTVWRYINNNLFKEKNFYILMDSNESIFPYFQGRKLENVLLKRLIFLKDKYNLEDLLRKENSYLPWNIVAYTKDEEELKQILRKIHIDRIESQDQDKSKVLLSVCIPSYNRGDLAQKNIKELLQTRYDNEMEFILSNNGTQNESKVQYTEISRIKDKRFFYHEFEENTGVSINCCKVCQLAKGQFMMLLSDEDSLYEDRIGDILNVIRQKGDTLSVIKTPHLIQGDVGENYTQKGLESYESFAFNSNYLSLNIFNNVILKEHNIVDYTLKHMDNPVCLYYPHMSWDLMVMQYGDVYSSDILLVKEEEGVGTDISEKVDLEHKKSIPWYQTIEGRLEQHDGNVELMKDVELFKNDFESYRKIFMVLYQKTLWLIRVSTIVHYGAEKLKQNLETAKNACIDSLNKSYSLYRVSLEDCRYKKDLDTLDKLLTKYQEI